jgi:hypothetical protein
VQPAPAPAPRCEARHANRAAIIRAVLNRMDFPIPLHFGSRRRFAIDGCPSEPRVRPRHIAVTGNPPADNRTVI